MKDLATVVAATLNKLYSVEVQPAEIAIQETRREFKGQRTVIAFPFIKWSKKSLDVTAAEIGNALVEQNTFIKGYNLVKGFLNIEFTDEYILMLLTAPTENKHHAGENVMVEYSSPNTNKPLHLGHIRNILLGHAMANILETAGYNVIRANLVNDRGIHICKSMLAWERFGNGETPETAGMKGDHLVGKYYVAFDKAYKEEVSNLVGGQGISEEEAKKQAPIMQDAQRMLKQWEDGDTRVMDLWHTMNGWVYAGFDETYSELGVSFDKIYYESDTYLLGKDIVEEGLKKGVFIKKEDGSVWIDLTAEGLDEKLVLRADGTSVYITQDLGTAVKKHDDYDTDKSIYVVGNEQDYHFKVLFLILKKLGYAWADGLYHLSYGMVDLPTGKMKSREGTVVDADDLIADMVANAKDRTLELGKSGGMEHEEQEHLFKQIGMGALKYFLLKVDPRKRIVFNPQESIDFQGHTGPFIQYTYARIRSLLSKSNAVEADATDAGMEDVEVELVMQYSRFMAVVNEAAEQYSPAAIANYVYETAKVFNKFYHELPAIIKLEDQGVKNRRLLLAKKTAEVIKKSMWMLGIEVPERM